ncbi:hypothetical protein EVG20_g1275 [Dentipellis fragilis]|uniref:Uncharacterized protein n=1 Tax=Dentipellis fragilis TaxID=205917 RepID=A0A4Y9ZAD5_9AGAM|nr:hypothetical protein EVG20_g1275 [Dentipellis fragilis]
MLNSTDLRLGHFASILTSVAAVGFLTYILRPPSDMFPPDGEEPWPEDAARSSVADAMVRYWFASVDAATHDETCSDTKLRQRLFKAWSEACTTMGHDFGRYIPFVMPRLLQSASIMAGFEREIYYIAYKTVALTDDDDDIMN